MYKLILSDLDGTLINDEGVILPSTIEALIKAHSKGINFCICTGRAPFSSTTFASFFPFDVIVSSLNGAHIQLGGKVIYSHPLKWDEVDAISKLLTTLPYSTVAYGEHTFFMEEDNDIFKARSAFYSIDGIASPYEKSFKAAREEGLSIYKFIVESATDEDKILIMKELKRQGFSFNYTSSSTTFFEIFPKDVDKGVTIDVLSPVLGISPKETIAFGDWDNDIPMFLKAGLSVAMEESTDNLIAVSSVTTKSNNEDGIAVALEKYLNF